MQARQRGARRGGYVLQGAPHAAADVEQQKKVQRLRFPLERDNRLWLVLVENREIGLGKIGEALAVAANGFDIHADQRDAGAKDGYLVVFLLSRLLRQQSGSE